MKSTWYQRALAVSAVFIFFTNLDLYLYLSGAVSLPPLIWIVAFGITAAPLLLSHSLVEAIWDDDSFVSTVTQLLFMFEGAGR